MTLAKVAIAAGYLISKLVGDLHLQRIAHLLSGVAAIPIIAISILIASALARQRQ